MFDAASCCGFNATGRNHVFRLGQGRMEWKRSVVIRPKMWEQRSCTETDCSDSCFFLRHKRRMPP